MDCWWEFRPAWPLWKAVWRYLKKLKMELPFDLVIPPLGIYQKKQITMFVRMWRKENPCTLLVGMQTGAATAESSMELPQKIKNGAAL